MMKLVPRLYTLLGIALLVSGASAKPKKQVRVANGAWGGQNITMNVGEKSATIEFGCAHGTIEGPLMTDAKGQFSWKGTFSAEHGGPVRIDEQRPGKSAIYSGSIKGQSMTLMVKLEGEESPLDTFTLTRGATGRLRKCM